MVKILFITMFLFGYASQAQLDCKSTLSENIGSPPQRIFEEPELLGLEMLASAILASRIGRGEHMGLVKGLLGNPLSKEDAGKIAQQLQRDLLFAVSKRKAPGVDVKYFVKKGMGSSKIHSVTVDSLRAFLQRPSSMQEMKRFISENIDAIIVNALNMPLENRFKSALKRSLNRASLAAAATSAAGLATWSIGSIYSGGGLEALVPLYISLLPSTWATVGGFSTGVGAVWSLARNKEGSPVFDLLHYDQSLGENIRARYARP